MSLDVQKKCTKCSEVKPFAAFGKDRRGKYGLHAACRTCETERLRKRRLLKAAEVKRLREANEVKGYKKCPKCSEWKPIANYSKKMRGKFGVEAQCKACTGVYQRRLREIKAESKGKVARRLCKVDEVMGLKECSGCKRMLPFKLFNKNGTGQLGLTSRCKECASLYNKQRGAYIKENFEVRLSGTKICSRCKMEQAVADFRINRSRRDGRFEICKSCISFQTKAKKEEKKKIGYVRMTGTKVCSRCEAERDISKFRPDVREKDGRITICYSCINKRQNDLIKGNLNWKLSIQVRCRLRSVVYHKPKSGQALEELGCSYSEFIAYIESKFYSHPVTGEGMTWENRGPKSWGFDHIQPLGDFDLSDESKLLMACHHTNVQPLWVEDHKKKHESKEVEVIQCVGA